MIKLNKIITVMLLSILTTASFAQKCYVVSVGIADYQYINNLNYTEADVSSFNSLMQTYDAEIVSIIGNDATHANVLRIIRDVFSKAKSDDTVILFFSGHGYEAGFCCYDMRSNSHIGGLSYQEMQILLRNCRAGRKFVFADACFSGGLSKQRTKLQVQAVSNYDVVFFLSSMLDETSLEMPGGPNGLFTHFLIQGLEGMADNNEDNVITITELCNYVTTNVSLCADKLRHNQHPTIWINERTTGIPVLQLKGTSLVVTAKTISGRHK